MNDTNKVTATGTAESKSWEQTPYAAALQAPELAAASGVDVYQGDVEGEGHWRGLTIAGSDGSGELFSLQRMICVVGGRSGTFMLRIGGAQPGRPNAAKRRANTKVAAIQAENPTSALTKWSSPIRVIVVGGPSGVPGGKPSTGSAEDRRQDHPDADEADEDRPPRAAPARAQRPPHPNRRRHHKATADQEVGHLDPAQVSVTENTGRVARDAEPRPGQRLPQIDGQIQRPGQDPTSEQCLGHRTGSGCLARWSSHSCQRDASPAASPSR
jgi:hypothetical protein